MDVKLTTVERAYHMLKNMISSQVLLPGQQIVETTMSAECGVSRTPIREAIRKLANEGLVEILPNRGAFVRRVTLEEVFMGYDTAGALEGMAAQLCAERLETGKISEESVKELEQYVVIMEEMVKNNSMDEWMDEDRKFHETLLSLAGNALLEKQRKEIIAQVELICWFVPPPTAEQRHGSSVDHRNIYEAILRRDGEAANYHSRFHRRRTQGLILPPGEFQAWNR